jgi:hypothetical protein
MRRLAIVAPLVHLDGPDVKRQPRRREQFFSARRR